MFLCLDHVIQDVCWVAADFCGAQPPFFAIPSFVFKHAFWADMLVSFGKSHIRCSGLPYPNSSCFSFDTIQPLFEVNNILNRLVHFSCPTQHLHILISWQPCLSFSFWLHTWIFFSLVLSDAHSESAVALQFMWGEQILWHLRMCHAQSTSGNHIGGR